MNLGKESQLLTGNPTTSGEGEGTRGPNKSSQPEKQTPKRFPQGQKERTGRRLPSPPRFQRPKRHTHRGSTPYGTPWEKIKLRKKQKTKSNPRERVPLTSLIKNTTTPPPLLRKGPTRGPIQNFKGNNGKMGKGWGPKRERQKRAVGSPRTMMTPPPGYHWLLGANENANTKKVVARQRETWK